jgi:hypothetical protein
MPGLLPTTGVLKAAVSGGKRHRFSIARCGADSPSGWPPGCGVAPRLWSPEGCSRRDGRAVTAKPALQSLSSPIGLTH